MIVRVAWRCLALASVLLMLTSAALAGYFLWSSTAHSGADCTFDNFGCPSNRDLATGLRWLMLLGIVAVVSGLTCFLRRRRGGKPVVRKL